MKRSIIIYFILFVFFFPIHQAFAAKGQALYEQGLEAFKSQNYKNSELLFRKTIEADDEYMDRAWFYLARSLYLQKKYSDALFEFNRFLLNSRTPDLSTESRFWIAESYNSQNDFLKAIEEYKRFISLLTDKSNPLMLISHERIGDIYYRQNRYDESIIEWKQALAIIASQPERKNIIGLKIAHALFDNKSYDDAENALTPLSSDKDITISSDALIYLGRINQVRVRHRIAIRFFQRVPEAQRTVVPYCDSLYFQAVSYLELGEKDNAKSSLQTFVSVGKGSSWFYHGKYQFALLTQAQNPAESIKIFQEIRDATTDRDLKMKVTLDLARLLAAQSKFAQAAALLEEIRSSDDGERSKQILFELGSDYLALNKNDNAEQVFDEMIKKYSFDNDADRIQFLLSVVYIKKGDSKKASEGFQKIKEINPFSKYLNESLIYIASAQYDQGNYKASIKYSEDYLAIATSEKKYDASVIILRSYIKLDDLAGAEKSSQVLIRRFSDKVGVDRVLVEFIRFMYNNGKDPKAAESFIFRSFADSDSAMDIYLLKGNIAYDKKDWKNAELNYSLILKSRGNEFNPQIFLRKANCFFNLENYDGVISFLTGEKLNVVNGDLSSQIILLLARSYYYTSRYDKAQEMFGVIKDRIDNDNDHFLYFDSSLKNDNVAAAKELALYFRDKREYHYKTLFSYGAYYRDIYNYDLSRGYFSQIYADNPGTSIGESSLMELAWLDFREGRYSDLIVRLKGIKGKEYDTKKTYLYVTAYVKLGKNAEALDLLKKNSDMVLKEDSGRALFRDLIVSLADNGEINEIIAVGKILTVKFPSDSDFVNYYTGNYYFKQTVMDKAVQYFSKIAPSNVEYRTEVFYKLGIINELSLKNQRMAIYYFSQIQDSRDYDEYVAESKIELSMLYFERGQKDMTKRLLEDVIAKKGNVAAGIRAANLYSYFGFEKR